jgi:hypothetical protein
MMMRAASLSTSTIRRLAADDESLDGLDVQRTVARSVAAASGGGFDWIGADRAPLVGVRLFPRAAHERRVLRMTRRRRRFPSRDLGQPILFVAFELIEHLAEFRVRLVEIVLRFLQQIPPILDALLERRDRVALLAERMQHALVVERRRREREARVVASIRSAVCVMACSIGRRSSAISISPWPSGQSGRL